MNFKFTLVLVVAAFLALDTDAAWFGRRRRRRSSTGKKILKWVGHAAKWAGTVLGDMDVAALKELRNDNREEYDRTMDELKQVLDREGDKTAQFVVDAFDYATAENSEQVSDAKKADMADFMDAFSQNIRSDEVNDEDFI